MMRETVPSYLPVDPMVSKPLKSSSHPAGLSMVVIEDHTLIREMLVATCANSFPGSRVVGAGDAARGLKLCEEAQPDLVFLDLALPDRDGLDLLPDLFSACSRLMMLKVILRLSLPPFGTHYRPCWLAMAKQDVDRPLLMTTRGPLVRGSMSAPAFVSSMSLPLARAEPR